MATFGVILALSLDTLISSLGYGVGRIKIPWYNMLIFSLISALILTMSILLSSLILSFFSAAIIKLTGGITLLIMGVFKLTDTLIKKLITNLKPKKRELKFSLLSLQMILVVFADPSEADENHSKSLSMHETIFLGLALNLDSMITGLAINPALNSLPLVFVITLAINLVAMMLGYFFGIKIGHTLKHDLSFLSGVLLVFIGICNLL